jgi:hypothetical protein
MRNFPIASAFLADLDFGYLDFVTYDVIADMIAIGAPNAATNYAEEQLFDFAREAA